jgi:hypothetical protein
MNTARIFNSIDVISAVGTKSKQEVLSGKVKKDRLRLKIVFLNLWTNESPAPAGLKSKDW